MQKLITIIVVLSLVSLVVGRYKRVITVDENAHNSQQCLWNNTLCSFHYALTHLQSDDYINVTSDTALLSSAFKIRNVNNITIRGQGNTTVMCNNTGGIYCIHCSNINFKGITWDQCGNPQVKHTPGGIVLYIVSNFTVQNCTFQHSKVRALSLVTVSGFVNIVSSYFVNNVNYDTIFCYSNVKTGYGHCSTANHTTTGGILIINHDTQTSVDIYIHNCVFSNNGYFGSVIIPQYHLRKFKRFLMLLLAFQ